MGEPDYFKKTPQNNYLKDLFIYRFIIPQSIKSAPLPRSTQHIYVCTDTDLADRFHNHHVTQALKGNSKQEQPGQWGKLLPVS